MTVRLPESILKADWQHFTKMEMDQNNVKQLVSFNQSMLDGRKGLNDILCLVCRGTLPSAMFQTRLHSCLATAFSSRAILGAQTLHLL